MLHLLWSAAGGASPLQQATTASDEAKPTSPLPNAPSASSSRRPGSPVIESWEQFVPPADSEFDWIQLTSKEWLKGELKALYNRVLEFDSDELGLLSFDWDDIKQIRSARPLAVRVEDPQQAGQATTLYGIVHILDSTVTVGSGARASQVERAQIVSLVSGSQNELDRWSGEVALATNLRSGNSDLADASVTGLVKRRTAGSRLMLDYRGNYSRAEATETSNNHRLKGSFDVVISSKFYWRQVFGEYYRDTFKNIDHQVSLGTAIGYTIIYTSETDWDVSAGLGGLYKRYVSVAAGDDIENTSPALGLGTRYDTELTNWLDYLFDFGFQIVDQENGTYIHHLVTTLSSDLIGDLDLDVSLIWDRVQDPRPLGDGTIPEQDDFQLTVGVSYEF